MLHALTHLQELVKEWHTSKNERNFIPWKK